MLELRFSPFLPHHSPGVKPPTPSAQGNLKTPLFQGKSLKFT